MAAFLFQRPGVFCVEGESEQNFRETVALSPVQVQPLPFPAEDSHEDSHEKIFVMHPAFEYLCQSSGVCEADASM